MRLAPPLSTGDPALPDDLDALLRAYFRAEMPDPWPAPPLVAIIPTSPAKVRGGRVSTRSRLALAASVVVLVGGTMLLPKVRPLADPVRDLRIGPGEAKRVKLTETLIQPKDQPTEWHIRATEELPPGK
jgi:hypothetical protein